MTEETLSDYYMEKVVTGEFTADDVIWLYESGIFSKVEMLHAMDIIVERLKGLGEL